MDIEEYVLVQNLREDICINFFILFKLGDHLYFSFTWGNEMIFGPIWFLETIAKQVQLVRSYIDF